MYTFQGKTYIVEQDVERFIDTITNNIPSTQINVILQSFNKFLIENLKFDIKNLRMVFVLDTNQALEAISYTANSGKKSYLEIIADHPFLNIIAPPQLFDEVRTHLKEFENRKKRITFDKLYQIWNRIKNKILKVKPNSYESKLIDSVRDKNDKPFISLFIDTNATGILTKDKDIIEHPFTFTTTSGKVVNFTITFNKGLISFTFKNAIDISLDGIMKIIVKFIFKFIHEGQKILSDFLNLISNFVKNNINKMEFSHLVFTAASLSSLIVLYMVDKDFKKSIDNILLIISNNLKSFIQKIISLLKNIKQNLLPLLDIVIPLIINGRIFYKYLEKRIENLILILAKLNIQQKRLNIHNQTLYYISN